MLDPHSIHVRRELAVPDPRRSVVRRHADDPRIVPKPSIDDLAKRKSTVPATMPSASTASISSRFVVTAVDANMKRLISRTPP